MDAGVCPGQKPFLAAVPRPRDGGMREQTLERCSMKLRSSVRQT
jgi:hypothetical protein